MNTLFISRGTAVPLQLNLDLQSLLFAMQVLVVTICAPPVDDEEPGWQRKAQLKARSLVTAGYCLLPILLLKLLELKLLSTYYIIINLVTTTIITSTTYVIHALASWL